METVASEFQPASGAPSPLLAPAARQIVRGADAALLEVGRCLMEQGYRFTTVTPASHARIIARPMRNRPSLTDIFGWSRPFRAGDLQEGILTLMADAGVLEIAGQEFRSNVRFSTLAGRMFVHSSFPTEQPDAVFFGPDTYRFARLITQSLGAMRRGTVRNQLRILDIGAGSGAGGLHAASLAARLMPAVTLTDVNRRALRFCQVNAALNGLAEVRTIESDLFTHVDGNFDLIVANPPYLVDPRARLYRHGGGDLGSELSIRIAEQGISRLASGGRLVLYTGSAIVDGIDVFYETLSTSLTAGGMKFSYEEIDPDVFGEELDHSPYDGADRIAVVGVTIDAA